MGALTTNPPEPDEILDLRGVPCPQNSARAILRLDGMDGGLILEIIIDDGEPIENIPPSLEEEGYEILGSKRNEGGSWRLLIRS